MPGPPGGQLVVYETPDGQVRVDVRLEQDTVWLSQRQMSELFDTTSDNVGLHLKNIFKEGELAETATTEELSVVQVEGRRQVRRQVKHFNLDAIISVGYPTAIAELRESIMTRGEAGPLFGQERGEALGGILGAIEQTFDGAALYPSAQVRAAHLLYFIIKDHPFSDGNKRIGALLFLDYLRRNRLLLRDDGSPRLADNAVVALALLIAESEPSHKGLMVRLILNLLGDESN